MGVYDDKKVSVVVPYNGSPVNYGWQTNIDEADQAVLGHQELATVTGPIVFGASRPKPARMSKEKTNGTVSSFVDWLQYDAAIAAGWKRTKGVLYGPAPRNSNKSVRVVAEVAQGVTVAWDMKRTQYTRISGDVAALGIQIMNATNGKHAVIGANRIQGANVFGAKKRDGSDILSVGYVGRTQVDNLPDGWSAVNRTGSGDPTVARP